MIKKNTTLIFLFFVFSCSNIEFVVKDNYQDKDFVGKTTLLISKDVDGRFSRELFAFFGNKKNHEYILDVSFVEKKENRIVKTNQVAEKIDYTLEADYNLYYKNKECKVFSKKIISKFSFTPKSEGYNFSSNTSFNKLYTSSIKRNIQNFVNLAPMQTNCL